MIDLLSWFFTAQLVGLAAFPLVFRALPGLADRGFGLAVPAGLLLVSTLSWLLGNLGVLPNDAWAWWLVVALVAVGGALALRGRSADFRRLFATRWPALAAAVIVFTIFFAGFAVMRANDPNITNTEKPMEILMLNAAVNADSAPLQDPWLAGETVAYYYGGYWNLGGLAKLTSVPTARGFNLSLALLAGMSASAIFSLVYGMVSRDGGSVRAAAVSGLASALLLLAVANLAGWWELAANYGVGSPGFYEWLSIDGLEPDDDPGNWRPEQFWWWFRASRVINTFDADGTGLDFTIQEFPAFSFILGDLHPHVISIPFVLLGIAVAFSLFVSKDRWDWGWLRKNPYAAVGIGLVLGASGFINQADILLMAALFGGVVILKAYGESGAGLPATVARSIPPLAVVSMAGVLLFSPFYFGTLGGQLQSPPIAPAEFGTRPVHFLTVWGVFILLLAPFVARFAWPVTRRYSGAAWRQRSGLPLALQGVWSRFGELRYAEDDPRPAPLVDESAGAQPPDAGPKTHPEDALRASADRQLLGQLDRWTWLTPVALTVFPYLVWAISHLAANDLAKGTDVLTRLGTALPLGIVFSVLLFVTLRKARQRSRPASLFALFVATLSVYLLFGAELFFVHDLFGNRMNTVFKFYFQVWIMLSAVGGYAMFYQAKSHRLLRGRPLLFSRTAAIALAVVLIGPAWYTVAAAHSKAEDYSGPVTLDGWAFLKRVNSADAEVIDWLLDEAEPGSRIVEAVGGSYTEYGRISAATGLPTLLGWPGHERQWRGSDELFRDRESEIREIYESEDIAVTGRLLERYEVTFVILGARERAGYPGVQPEKFDSLGEKVFESDGVAVYQVRGFAS